jgi:hypothetical protein
MFEKIFVDSAALLRHRSAPFADERECYLQHCADFGAAPASLRSKSSWLLLLATCLGPDARRGGPGPLAADWERTSVDPHGILSRTEFDRCRSALAEVPGVVAQANHSSSGARST